jgi:NTP pyrophosphatase (non-canonical NTP hydrolase)
MEVEERFKKIVKYNGTKFQYEIAIEEMSECIQAIQKVKRGKGSVDHLLSEMADVYVTFGCLIEALKEDYTLWEDVKASINRVMDQKTAWIENCEVEGEPEKPKTHQDFKETEK